MLLIIGWFLAAVALVTGTVDPLAPAGVCLLEFGVLLLAREAQWARIARTALRSSVYESDYREAVLGSSLVRMSIGVGFVLIGSLWLIVALWR